MFSGKPEAMGRRPCCDKNGLQKGPWTPQEDRKLIEYIERHGHGNWRVLPKLAGLSRCGKSCRLRWTNYLRSDIKRGNFSSDEDQAIIHLHSLLGNKWSVIASNLPGRTDNEIKNYWNTRLKKRLLGMGIDPVTHRPRMERFILKQWQNAIPEARWAGEQYHQKQMAPSGSSTVAADNGTDTNPLVYDYQFDKETAVFDDQMDKLCENQMKYSPLGPYVQNENLMDDVSYFNIHPSTSMFSEDDINSIISTGDYTPSTSVWPDEYHYYMFEVENSDCDQSLQATMVSHSSSFASYISNSAPEVNTDIYSMVNMINGYKESFSQEFFSERAENTGTRDQQQHHDIAGSATCTTSGSETTKGPSRESDVNSDDSKEYWNNMLKLAAVIPDPDMVSYHQP